MKRKTARVYSIEVYAGKHAWYVEADDFRAEAATYAETKTEALDAARALCAKLGLETKLRPPRATDDAVARITGYARCETCAVVDDCDDKFGRDGKACEEYVHA